MFPSPQPSTSHALTPATVRTLLYSSPGRSQNDHRLPMVQRLRHQNLVGRRVRPVRLHPCPHARPELGRHLQVVLQRAARQLPVQDHLPVRGTPGHRPPQHQVLQGERARPYSQDPGQRRVPEDHHLQRQLRRLREVRREYRRDIVVEHGGPEPQEHGLDQHHRGT